MYSSMHTTFLFVDDEPCFLSSMQRLLRKEPFCVLTAENGTTALELLKDRQIGTVILDYKMSEIDGLTLLKIIRQEYPHIIPIMLTAAHELDVAIKAINDLGVYKFILKPFNNEHLLNILRDIHSFIDANNDEAFHFQQQLKNRDAFLKAYNQECVDHHSKPQSIRYN